MLEYSILAHAALLQETAATTEQHDIGTNKATRSNKNDY